MTHDQAQQSVNASLRHCAALAACDLEAFDIVISEARQNNSPLILAYEAQHKLIKQARYWQELMREAIRTLSEQRSATDPAASGTEKQKEN